MVKTKTYGSGLKLIVKKIDGLLSVSTGVMVAAGSRGENAKNNGITHFIEHMMFKGTKNRTAYEISDGIDKLGAQINAFTTKEMTCYYTKSTAEHFGESLEILSDIFFDSVFSESEMAKEKNVVKEEISMVNDTPDELCMDILARAFYGDEGFGRTILGLPETVEGIKRADILSYIKNYYTPANIVISVAGNIDFERTDDLIGRLFEQKIPSSAAPRKVYKPDKVYTGHLFESKDIEQSHISLAFPSIELDHPSTNDIAVANAVLGGSMSSRLFQKIREELGLAYTVFSYLSTYQTSGIMTIYAGVNPKNTKTALDAIISEVERFKKDGLTNEEFLRGKEQIKSAFVFGQESTSAQMMAYGKYLLLTGKVFDFENKIEQISLVTLDGIRAAIDQNYNFDKAASACVGKDTAPLF